MTITLHPDQEAWLEARVASGHFDSVEAAARQILSERIAELDNGEDEAPGYLDWAKPYVDEGLAALDRGERRLVWPTDPTYSKVDPCDPATRSPENMSTIAEAKRNVNVGALSTGIGMTAEDHMSTRSLPVLARFELAAAIESRRTFAREAVGRTDPPPRRQAIMALLKEHDALDILVVLGGTIPTHDIPALKEAGVAAVFGPGTQLETTVEFIRRNILRAALKS